MTEPGHNSVGGIAADRLRSIVDRYERLEEEVRGLRSDQKDIMAEAKSAGFDVKALRALIAERRKDPADVEEHESILDTYRRALGEYATTELGAAAMKRAAA